MSETALLETRGALASAIDGISELTLELTDGCDRCGFTTSYEKTGDGNERISYIYAAQALVAVRLKSGHDLKLCGHHYAKHETALKAVVDFVVDQRELAAAPPASGSVHAG